MPHPDQRLPPPATLWLEITDAARRHLFELPPGDEKAIVVGSSLRADVRVDRPGIPPVHFHFEREGDAVYLAPDSPAELRANAAPVGSRRLLPSVAVLEFQGIELAVRVLFEQPEGAPAITTTAEHVWSYQLDQPLDAQTVRATVPGWDTLAEPETTFFEREPDTIFFEREPETLAFVREPAGMAALEHTLVIERREPEPEPPVTAAVIGNELPAALERTLPIPRAVPQPAASLLQAALETQVHGTMLADAPSGIAAPPATPAQPPVTPTPVMAVYAPRTTEPAAPRPEPRFEPTQAAPRLHVETKRAHPTAVSRSLDEATTAFEALSPVPEATVTMASPPAASAPAEPAPSERPAKAPSLMARLGLQVKARPIPMVAAALGFALVVGVGMASVVTALVPPPASTAVTSPSQPKDSAAADDPRNAPSEPVRTETPPAPVASARPAPNPRAPTVPRAKTRGEPADAKVAEAIGHVSAGRYAEAAGAYGQLSSRADAEVFQALAGLLERASSADCKPSATQKPLCPEVLR